ncbi:MAG: metallophosphoesterase, partial [Chthonomonadaceae bacterium]|nr:metallophosphoesterase [Chthonomonadaceae bacterium]
RIDTVASTLMPDEGADTFRVLHISDIHNNLAAYPFVREVADRFQVAFIVDTGDLTDFGSPFEAAIVQEIARLPYPYVFVAGNHDSREVERALARAPNVILLDGTPKVVEGLTILGMPDPAASRQGLEGINVSPEEMQENAGRLWQKVKEMPEPPDIVAVHDPRQSVRVWGTVPLVLCGHLHREGIEEHEAPPPGISQPAAPPAAGPSLHNAPSGKTIVCNAGTTGAAGTRYFDRKGGVPFTCAVLTFQRAHDTEKKAEGVLPSASHPARAHLRAITLISLDGTLHQYSVARHTFAVPDASRGSATD